MIAILAIAAVALLLLAAALLGRNLEAAAFGLGALTPALLVGSAIVTPANTVYAGGARYDECVQTYKVKTTTNLRAGVFVIKDTDDDHVKAAGAEAANVIGVLTEKNWTNPEWDPTTAPTAEDEFDVLLCGSGAWAKVRNGANIAVGARLSTSATARAAAFGTATQGVGIALHDSDGSGAETDLVAVI